MEGRNSPPPLLFCLFSPIFQKVLSKDDSYIVFDPKLPLKRKYVRLTGVGKRRKKAKKWAKSIKKMKKTIDKTIDIKHKV